MNKWKEFAELLNLGLEEEFNIKNTTLDATFATVYKFTEKGLMYKASFHDWQEETDQTIPYHILTGQFEIVNIPWKPKVGEIYWYYTMDSQIVESDSWCNGLCDYSYWKLGNCFKTSKAAETRGKEIMEQIKKEYEEA